VVVVLSKTVSYSIIYIIILKSKIRIKKLIGVGEEITMKKINEFLTRSEPSEVEIFFAMLASAAFSITVLLFFYYLVVSSKEIPFHVLKRLNYLTVFFLLTTAFIFLRRVLSSNK
jgi:hypothetical protein